MTDQPATMVSMWQHLRTRRRTRSEHGLSEVAAMVFVVPILVGLLFTMIEVSMYLHTRSGVENAIQSAAIGAAEDGGDYWARSNTIGQPWSQWATSQVNQACNANAGNPRCEIISDGGQVACNPDVVIALPGVDAALPGAGFSPDDGYVSCTATVQFHSLAGDALMDGPLGFGIGQVTTSQSEFSLTVPASRSITGYGF